MEQAVLIHLVLDVQLTVPQEHVSAILLLALVSVPAGGDGVQWHRKKAWEACCSRKRRGSRLSLETSVRSASLPSSFSSRSNCASVRLEERRLPLQ